MVDVAGNRTEDVYSVKRLKEKHQECYKDYLYFAEVNGRNHVICFLKLVSPIISDKWCDAKRKNTENDSTRIGMTDSKINKAQTSEMSCNMNSIKQTKTSVIPIRFVSGCLQS